jgi:hypothetical protein
LVNKKAAFNEKFAMKTILEYDYNTGEYESKAVIIYLLFIII